MIQVAQILKHGQRTVLDLADGNRMELLSSTTENAYCVMLGTIPPGGGVALQARVAQSFHRADVGPDYLHRETRPRASGDGTDREHNRLEISLTGCHSAHRRNIRALWTLAR